MTDSWMTKNHVTHDMFEIIVLRQKDLTFLLFFF